MQFVYFTLAAIILYFASDRILDLIERRAGQRFKNRSIYFFGILVSLSVITFWAIQIIFGS